MSKKIHIGIAIDQLDISAWQYALVEKLIQSNDVTVELILQLPKVTNQSFKGLSFLHYKLDQKLFRPTADALETKTITSLISNPNLFQNYQKETNYSIDLLLWLSLSKPDPHLYQNVSYGIWSFAHGYSVSMADNQLGYWEMIEKKEVLHSALVIHQSIADVGKIAYESWSMQQPFAMAKSRSAHLWKLTEFVSRALHQLKTKGGDRYFNDLRKFKFDPSSPLNPNVFKSISNLIHHGSRLLNKGWNKQRFRDQWILLAHLNKKPSEAFDQFYHIIPPKDRFWADPFLCQKDNQRYLFFEELFFSNNKGHIAVMSIDESGKPGTVTKIIEEDYHLSYPFLFEFKKKLYMIPESSEKGIIPVYACIEFPFKWQHKMNLMESVTAVDTTLYYHNQKWWLFTNIPAHPHSSKDDELHLFYADTPLTTDWKSHPQNPIISDVRSARPAGHLFIKNGKLIRPSQDCSTVYGYGFNFNEIEKLTTTEYREKVIKKVKPNFQGLQRTHSYVHIDGLTVIDGVIKSKR